MGSPSLGAVTSEVVIHAINDATSLIQHRGATSGVDRVHTALHGYLKSHCESQKLTYPDDASVTYLFKALRLSHPALKNLGGARQQDIDAVLKAFASIIDVLNPLRNKASVAHPNSTLLHKDEALVVINAVNTILHYLEAKFRPVE